MPRANRYHVPGQVWHITHRCHQREFLLANRDQRQRWQYWLFEARRRYGLCVLNYIVTRNHIHLLVRDRGEGEIARSMQLVAGRAAQEFNRRRERRGAYWEDRYHATAVSTDHHLVACMRYIDLNMVRTGVVAHPIQWRDSGYHAIQNPRQRYRVIDLDMVVRLLGCQDLSDLQRRLDRNVEFALKQGVGQRQPMWSEPVAVGDQAFVDAIQAALGKRALARSVVHTGDAWLLADTPGSYGTRDRGSAVV